VRDKCGRCFKEEERGNKPRLCSKCNKLMFVAPGKDYTVCRDCNESEKVAKHEALRRSVPGPRIIASASSLDEYVRTLVRYIDSADQVYFVDLDGAARKEWKLPPMKRGAQIDGGFDRGSLVFNFPHIDLWTNGDATSIKSIDLGARAYQTINSLDRLIGHYIDDLAGYTGTSENGWGGTTIREKQIKTLTLLLVVTLISASNEQLNYLYSLGQSYYAEEKLAKLKREIKMRIIVFIID